METRKVTSLMASNCKKHLKHQQSPGVCSLCLRERLSKIPGSSLQVVSTVSSSSSSSLISSVSSVCSSNVPSKTASPMHEYGNQRKSNHDHVEGRGYFSFLRKSRSMAYVSEKFVENDVKKKKGDGFWSKLFGLKKSNILVHKRSTEEASPRLMHSRTMREMLTTRI